MTSDSIQFDDLNIDVLYNIFDQIEFKDLISLTELNPKYRELITRHYALKHRVQEKLIHFQSSNVQRISFEGNSIKISNTRLSVKFLRNFGQWISRIKLDRYNSLVGSAMNKYCSESLAELSFPYNVQNEILWQNPFKNVSKFHLMMTNCYPKYNDSTNLNEKFPSLRHLHIEFVQGFSSNNYVCHFPHLEHMEFPRHTRTKTYIGEVEVFERFMGLNPQIRNVHLDLKLDLSQNGSLELLQITNEKLPNLEVLELTAYTFYSTQEVGDSNTTIHFKNVEKLILHVYNERTKALPIVFDRLKEIEIGQSNYSGTNVNWLRFIATNRGLQILKANYMLNSEQWRLIGDNLPLLEEVQTHWKSSDYGNELINIMNRETNLKKVKLITLLSLDNFTALCDSLHPKWRIDGELPNVMFVPEITFLRNN